MNIRGLLALSVLLAMVCACASSNNTVIKKNNTAVDNKNTTESINEKTYSDAKTQQSCDLVRGQRVLRKCLACHSMDNTGKHSVGPNLYSILGRKVGTIPGFRYSKAMQDSDLVWDVATMDEFLISPSTLLPGNTMAFAGLRKTEDRNAVICALQSSSPSD